MQLQYQFEASALTHSQVIQLSMLPAQPGDNDNEYRIFILHFDK